MDDDATLPAAIGFKNMDMRESVEVVNHLLKAPSRVNKKNQKETLSTSALSHKDANSTAMSTRSSSRKNC